MEQLRFMLEYDIPFIDYKGVVKAGEMQSELKSISTLALLYQEIMVIYRAIFKPNMNIGFHWF